MIFNKGYIAEGILSSAMYLKLKERTFSVDELKKFIVEQLQEENHSINLDYTLRLSNNNFISLKDSKLVNNFSGIYKNSFDFAHSYFFNNVENKINPDDNIILLSDGIVDQKTSKCDIAISKNIEPILKINLKCNSRTIHQSGSSFEKMQFLFNKFGVEINRFENGFYKDVSNYREIFSFFANLLNNVSSEKIFDAIKYFATLNDEQLLEVKFNTRNFEIFNYNQLDYNLNLYSMLNKNSLRPNIVIMDRESNKKLFQTRLEVRKNGTYIKNIMIEKGIALKELTRIKHGADFKF